MIRNSHLPLVHRYVAVGQKKLLGLVVPLGEKRLVVLVGSRGYVMCGYLNMSAANRFGDVAAKVSGVATIADVLKSRVKEASRAARKRGIVPGILIKKILPLIV